MAWADSETDSQDNDKAQCKQRMFDNIKGIEWNLFRMFHLFSLRAESFVNSIKLRWHGMNK